MRAYDDLEALRRRRGARTVQVGAQKRDARGIGGKDARGAGTGLPDLEGEVPLGVGVPYYHIAAPLLREVLQARGHLGDVVWGGGGI